MSWEDVKVIDNRWTWLTGILTIFFCWLAQEVMERCMGMAPSIRNVSDLIDNAKTKGNKAMHHIKMNRMITKKLDIDGKYRITTRGTIYYIKGGWSLILLFASFVVFLAWPDWFIQHFIYLNNETVDFAPYQHIAASIACFYAWETTANRYGRLNYSILVHHWLTILASLLILLRVYTPFATWYGFTQVACLFSINLIMGFRATVSNNYPIITRNLFKCSVYWTLVTVLANFVGQFYFLIVGLATGKILIISCITMTLTICGWVYDDYHLIRALYDFSTHNYEDAELYTKKNTLREMGGRMMTLVFAKSVLYDWEQHTKEQEMNDMKQPQQQQQQTNGNYGSKKRLKIEKPNKHNQTIAGATTDDDEDDHPHSPGSRLVKLQSLSANRSEKELRELQSILYIDAEEYKEWTTNTKSNPDQSNPNTPLKYKQNVKSPPKTPDTPGSMMSSRTNPSIIKVNPINSDDRRDLINMQKEIVRDLVAGQDHTMQLSANLSNSRNDDEAGLTSIVSTRL